MNKKLNCLLITALILPLVATGILYSKINELGKNISEIRKEQTYQKEYTENLRHLLTLSWKKYQNNDVGFSFRYPTYAEICTGGQFFEKTDISIGIRLDETCKNGGKYKDAADIYISVGQNTSNYKTAEESFYKEFTSIDKSLNPQLGYFKIGGLTAYGAGIIREKSAPQSEYGAIILRDNKIIRINGFRYEIMENRKFEGNKSIFDSIISSFVFFNN